MVANPYWSIYINLEKELLELTNNIYFCEEHLGVYSIKIAEILIRCVVEIESISKDLWKREGGTSAGKNGKPKEPFFDSDCLKFLEDKWMLHKKEVIISSDTIFLKQEYRTLTPFKNAGKKIYDGCREKGAKGSPDCACCCNWNNAYQNIKHNRVAGLPWASVKHLIDAMAALFILNLYYMNPQNKQPYYCDDILGSGDFDLSCGSNLFVPTAGDKLQNIFIKQNTHLNLEVNVNQNIKYYERDEDGNPVNFEIVKDGDDERFHEFPLERKQTDRRK